ncbi:MAG: TonB-dependent receptor [Candidatus Kapabacteria bacterium]|nr:TonB-dependent receptor [Candidatus Kapabacteria bacterium]
MNDPLLQQSKDTTTKKPRVPAVPQRKVPKRDTLRYNTQQVVVTGTRNEVLLKDSPVRVEVIDKQQTQSTAMVTVADILKEQTGMVIAQGTVRTGVQMMGLGPDYTMILVDGQPLTGRVGGVLDLSRVSVGNIERIEIVKGPMSSLYGSEAMAGVINIITRKPDNGYSGKAYFQYLQYGAAETQVENNYSNDEIDITSFLNLKSAQPFTQTQDTFSFPYSGFRDYTLQTRAKWFMSSNMILTANLRAFGSESRGKFLEGAAGNITSNEGAVETTDRSATFGYDWTHGKARLSAQLYGTIYNETYNFDVAQGSAGRTDNFRRRTSRSYLQYDVLWNDKNRFTFGGEFLYDDAQGSRYSANPLYRTIALFGQWEGNPNEYFSYALSVRYDNNSAFALPESFYFRKAGIASVPLLPRFSLSYKPTANLRFYATVGEGFKAPDFRQLYVQFSNRLPGAGYDLIGARLLGIDLQPEQSHSYDAGVFYQPDPINFNGLFTILTAFDIRYYNNNLRNLIEFYPYSTIPLVYSYRNVAEVFTQGVEATVKYTVILDTSTTLSGQIGYQYLDAQDARVATAIENRTAGYVIPSTGEFKLLRASDYGGLWYRSNHTGTARVQIDDRTLGMTANVRAQYIGAFGEQQLNKNPDVYSGSIAFGQVLDSKDEYVDGYWNVNATVTKRFAFDALSERSQIQVSVGVNNLFNVTNPRYIPNLIGRQFFVNTSVTW